jgi:hypothetical protein
MCSWLAWRVEPSGSVSVCSMSGDFYEGTAGVAALLLKVAGADGVPAAAYLERLGVGAAKRSAKLAADEMRAGRECGGLFLGPLSTVLAICEIQRDRPASELADSLSELAEILAGRLSRRPFRYATGDPGLLGGQAGKLAAVSRLATAFGLADAERQVFLDQVPSAARVRRLPGLLPFDGPGIAHGLAGLVMACVDAGRASGDPEYEPLAAALLERCLADNPDSSPPGWCRGSTGIAVAASYAAAWLSPEYEPIAAHVLTACLTRMRQAARTQAIGTCLCHGTAGLRRLRSLASADLEGEVPGSSALNFGSDLGLFTGATDAWLEAAGTGLWPLPGPLAAAVAAVGRPDGRDRLKRHCRPR